ncbi:tyrosine-type recombinase/integrase [Paenibacillus sp. Leaf72]|uniref:tyrosine-type recombinase/integrase n=1 Tax=Paenibacillus sp. Leaf72 TaxID=1736234 RepID=UPI0006F287FD|nr:tyrosine-type recombinase/integrase [Paenibacillus sp. Leaf72]KQN96762.1 hypothetical protein ASF12_22065 [Paenibacillus sp. Leaf72]
MTVYKQNEYEHYLKIEQKKKDLTVYGYINEVACFMGWFSRKYPHLEYYRITQSMIKDYLNDEKEDGKVETTINKKISILKSYFDFLWQKNYLAGYDPAVKIKRNRKLSKDEERFYLGDDDLEKLIAGMRLLRDKMDTQKYFRDVALTTLYLKAGLRLPEAIYLLRDDVIVNDDCIVFVVKAGHTRHISMSIDVAEPIMTYLKICEQEGERSPYLFVTSKGTQIRPRTIHLIFETLSKRLGIHVHPRKLRNTYMVEQIKLGKSRDEVAAELGINYLTIPDFIYENTNM